LDLASRRYLEGNGPLAITLEDPDGTRHDLQVPRAPFNQLPPSTPWLHPSGFLDAAPGVFYINMGGDVEADGPDLFRRMDAALPQAEAVIVDMRGYPGLDHYGVVIRLVGTAAMRSPIFEVPVWTGPDQVEDSSVQYTGATFGIDAPGFAGPIVLLVGPTSVSAAENFSSMLTPFGNVTVMGRASAATNGNITGMNLPGGTGLSMTGMRILGVGGEPFHGIGIVPDVEIWPTAESLWTQTDVALEAAIERLTAE
jgi:C-terminal processing protease CtpA/Prc